VRTRAIVASVLVSIAALIGIGAGGRSDPPARAAKRAVRGPIIAVSPMADYDGIAAADHEIETYLAWQHEQDLIAAYLDAIAHPPPPPPPPVARAPVARQAAPNLGSCNGNVECFLACTIQHESISAGIYTAVSPGGTYRGAYQFDTGTWRSNAIAAGYGEWANTPVDQVPGAVQDAVAAYLYSVRGNQPWGGRC